MNYKLREFQVNAINSIKEKIDSGCKRLIIQMQQGMGIHVTCLSALQEIRKVYKWNKINIIIDNEADLVGLKNAYIKFIDNINGPNIIYSFVSSFSNKTTNIDSDILILFNINEKQKFLDDYIENFNGPIIIFANRLEQDLLESLLSKNFEFAYKRLLEDIINELKENRYSDLQKLNKNLENIEITLFENVGKILDTKVVQKIVKEVIQISTEYKESSKKYEKNIELINTILDYNLKIEELQQIGYRKQQLKIFDDLLNNNFVFESEQKKIGRGPEAVWQIFFEKNNWILGYGISSILHSSLDGRKLEQIVAGFDFNSSGKRVDALMKSRGYIESLCFIELKTHKTDLLNPNQYRKDCWHPSYELSGAISQIQKTVQRAMKDIQEKTEIVDESGNPTGEIIFNFTPKSYLIIGSLREFETNNGINISKYSSFELFRKNIKIPEIITFDELYERAKFLAFDDLNNQL